jgi:hypothetical protein
VCGWGGGGREELSKLNVSFHSCLRLNTDSDGAVITASFFSVKLVLKNGTHYDIKIIF